jgi:hypothetical protein
LPNDLRRHTSSNGVRRKIVGNDRSSPNDTAIADIYPAKNLYTRSKPTVATDRRGQRDVGFVSNDLVAPGDCMVRRKNAAMHRNKRMVSNVYAAMAIDHGIRPEKHPLP